MNILDRREPSGSYVNSRRVSIMFLVIGIILLVLWIGGFFVFHIASWAIHLLIIFAIISIVWNFIGGNKA